MRYIKRILFFFCCCGMIYCAMECKERFLEYKLARIRENLVEQRYIIHAGGNINDSNNRTYAYTNCREALDNCKTNNKKIIEIDLMQTADGRWVCAHDNPSAWAHGYDFEKPPTYDEFCNSKYSGIFTPLTLDYIAEFLRENRDYYIITDVKDDNEEACKYIKSHYADVMNNFIIQIYHENEYQIITEMGFRYIIYTLYRCTGEETQPASLYRAATKFNLVGFTFSSNRVEEEDFMSVMLDTGVPLFVHTVNDKNEMKQYISAGISGIYTDVVEDEQLYYE